jgi:hypothetical protein
MLPHNVFGSSTQLQSLETVAASWLEGWQNEGKVIPIHATRHMMSGAQLHSLIIWALMGRMVGFTSWSPYSRGKSFGYPLNRTVGGPQSRS